MYRSIRKKRYSTKHNQMKDFQSVTLRVKSDEVRVVHNTGLSCFQDIIQNLLFKIVDLRS